MRASCYWICGPMSRSTPHDFCEIACSSCRGSLPAPVSSRSITNFGMDFPPVSATHDALHDRTLEAPPHRVLRQGPQESPIFRVKKRDSCPGSMAVVLADARFARPYDRLVAVLDADLVEDAGDVVAHGLFGQFQGSRDLGIVEPAGDAVEHRALARR